MVQQAFDYSADALLILSVDGRILRANQSAKKLLGYSVSDLTRMSVSDLFPTQGPEAFRSRARLLVEGGKTLLYENTLVTKDGAEIPVEIHAQAFESEGQTFLTGAIRDVRIRKQMESKALKAQRLYELLFEHAGSVHSVYTPDCRLTYYNTTFRNFLGRGDEDLTGLSVEELFGPKNGSCIRERMVRILATDKSETFLTLFPFPGGPTWIQATYKTLRNSVGTLEGIIVFGQDVTENQVLNDRISRIQKLESLGLLAAGIAHDFNNLLAGLQGQEEVARVHFQFGRYAEGLERLARNQSVFDRGKALTRRLLTFSKGGAPVRTPWNLGPYIEEWVAIALSGSDLGSSVSIAPDLWVCDCDVHQIGQIISNFLINSRQASPPGGTITVNARNVDKDGPFLAISVSDQGPGIPPEVRAKIFDPFFTTKPMGTGLGLAMAYSIANQHRGWIDLDTSVGEGTTFTLMLPATQDKARKTDGDRPECQDQGHGLTAVVLDDEEMLRDAAGEMLTLLGFRPQLTKTGAEVLEYFQNQRSEGIEIGIFLLDLTIRTGAGGEEIAKQLRAQGAPGRIILMSGYSDNSVSESLRVIENTGWLAKPFSLTDLGKALGIDC